MLEKRTLAENNQISHSIEETVTYEFVTVSFLQSGFIAISYKDCILCDIALMRILSYEDCILYELYNL